MRPALAAEWLKFRRSQVVWISSAALVLGTLALLSGLSMAVASGNAQLIAKAGEWGTADWHGLLGVAPQVVAAADLIGFSVVLAWLYAREFSDSAVNGLFALPTSLSQLAAAKLVIFLGWGLAIALLNCLLTLGLGLSLGYGPPGLVGWQSVWALFRLGVGTAVIALPTAWVATRTRSLLAGVGFGIGQVVLAQVTVLSGGGGWAPMAVPALQALYPEAVGAVQVVVAAGYGLAGAVGCLAAWRRFQLNH